MREWSIIYLLLAGGCIAARLLPAIIHVETAPGLTRIKSLWTTPVDVDGKDAAAVADRVDMEHERC
jgi:hypothetical protein